MFWEGGGLNMGGCWRGVIGLREWVLLERESMIGERGLGKVLWGGGGEEGLIQPYQAMQVKTWNNVQSLFHTKCLLFGLAPACKNSSTNSSRPSSAALTRSGIPSMV